MTRRAALVWDGGQEVYTPSEMGVPRADQMLGTPRERLVELAGRVCYDSLGTGRPSFSASDVEGYHAHIEKVGHGSVLAHAAITVEIECGDAALAALFCLQNFPGVFAGFAPKTFARIRVTFNPRVVRDWDKIVKRLRSYDAQRSRFSSTHTAIRCVLEDAVHLLMPGVFKPICRTATSRFSYKITEPIHQCEKWVSIWMRGSRGFSHEQVRHTWQVAVSQRSTRFVNESESNWVEHPLFTMFVKANPNVPLLLGDSGFFIHSAQQVYDRIVGQLQGWLLSRGIDKLTARKQARGAARGYLGNALETQMIFSASVSQWREMLVQRLNRAADAEIRAVYAEVLSELRTSRYADSFVDMISVPSPDGIGECLA